MASNLERFDIYEIAIASLTFVLLSASFLVAAFSVFKCRTLRDPARGGFTWMKLSWLFFCLHLSMVVLINILDVIYAAVTYSEVVFIAMRSLYPFEYLFGILAIIGVFLALTTTGLGILQARTGEPVKQHSVLRIVLRVIAGLFAALAIAAFGFLWDYNRRIFDLRRYYDDTDGATNIFFTSRKVAGTLEILLFCVSVAVLAFAVFVYVRVAKAHEKLKTSCVYFLVCSVLWVGQMLFLTIWRGLYLSYNEEDDRTTTPMESIIYDFFFNNLVIFIILVLLFVLGKKKKDGLWAKGQGFPANNYFASGYGPQYNGPGQVGQQQYPPQPQGYTYANVPGQQQHMPYGWQQQQAAGYQQQNYHQGYYPPPQEIATSVPTIAQLPSSPTPQPYVQELATEHYPPHTVSSRDINTAEAQRMEVLVERKT